MNHLQRFERSMLAGAVVAILATILSLSRHKALAAQAAASHESLTRLMVTGIAGVMLVTGLGVFAVATIVALARRFWRRSRYGGDW